jgi:hypothetical protein
MTHSEIIMEIKDAVWELKNSYSSISVQSIMDQSRVSDSLHILTEEHRAEVELFVANLYNDPSNYRTFNKTKCNGYLELIPIKQLSKEQFLYQLVNR